MTAGGSLPDDGFRWQGRYFLPVALRTQHGKELAMQRCNFWFIIAGLTSVWLFAGSTRADDPRAEPDKRPRLVALDTIGL